MKCYKIAEAKIHVKSTNNLLERRFVPFETGFEGRPDLRVHIEKCERIEEPAGRVLVDDEVKWYENTGMERGFHVCLKNKADGSIMARMDTDNSWENVHIKCLNIDVIADDQMALRRIWADFYSFNMLGMAFRFHLLHRNGMVMHASSISFNGSGIIFTAPSGTGKSTHVRLWEQCMENQVAVLNDDTPAIRFIGGEPVLFGTPWSGSTEKYLNTSAPLGAIVVLSQAPVNNIRQLSQTEALPMLMPRSFLPYFDKDLMEKACMMLERLIRHVPVYHLKCRPDKEAVEMVYQCVR